jgi:hypothetical protein
MNLLVTMWQGKEHVTLITNVDRLTGLLICPKCGECVAKRDRAHDDKVFKEHVERCTGKRQKEVRLLYREQPYVPHIMKNPKMIDHLINNTVLEPLNEYMTYDFETMDRPVEDKNTGQTKTHAVLELL